MSDCSNPCTKRAYTHYHRAEALMREMRKRGKRVSMYVCRKCGYIHIGHKHRTKRQDARRQQRQGEV